VLACGGIAAALADACVSLLPPAFKAPAHAAVIIVVIAAIAALNIGGVKRGSRLVNFATIIKLLPLAVFLIAGAWAVHTANFAPQPMQHARDGLGRALILALFTLTGMEGSLSASGEVANPSRSIPRALAIAIGSAVLLYIAIQITAQGILGPALAHSTVPLADAMARISPALRALMLAGAAISMLGWITGDILATPRMFFAFGRDGLYPRILGRTHPRTHAPHIAILCYAAIAATLALTGTFAELAVLATLASAVLYIGGCLAAWRLARNGVARAGTPLNFRWLPAAMVVGIAGMIALIALASRAEIIGLLAVTSAAAVLYLAQTRLRPKNSPATPVV
jgi:amino acid transporter